MLEKKLHNSFISKFSRRKTTISLVEKIIVTFIYITGLLLVLLPPPFQKADEILHFYKTISIATGNFVCTTNNSGELQNFLPKDLVNLRLDTFSEHIAFNPQVKFPRSLFIELLKRNTHIKDTVNETSTCTLPPIYYLPVGLVLSIPILLGSPPIAIFYLGRFAALTFSLLIFYLCLKIAPKNVRAIPIFIYSLPMSLYQMSSYSKDWVTISVGTLFFVLTAKIFQSTKVKPIYIMAQLISVLIIIFSRVTYFPLLLIPFINPNLFKTWKIHTRNFSNRKIWILLICTIIITTVICLLIGIQYLSKAKLLISHTNADFVSPYTQIIYISEHPFRFLKLIIDNLIESEFYIKSIIAYFGWLDYLLDSYVYLLYYGFIFWVGTYTFGFFKDTKKWQTLILLIALTGTFFTIWTSHYIFSTPVGADYLTGVQGRYLIILLPFIFWLITSIVHKWPKITLLFLIFITSFSIINNTLTRYYKYDEYYYRPIIDKPSESLSQSIFIDHKRVFSTIIDPTKKIAGISIYFSALDKPANTIYRLNILDSQCQTSVREFIINPNKLNYSDFNDFKTKSFSYPSNLMYWSIEPYGKPNSQIVHHIRLLESTSQKNLISTPLYLF